MDIHAYLNRIGMAWGVYRDYLTGRAQGAFRRGPSQKGGLETKLRNRLYRSFGLANKVSSPD